MSKWNPIERIKSVDKDVGFKWLFLVAAGILGLVANVFDTRHKDRQYESKLKEKLDEQAKKLEEKAAA